MSDWREQYEQAAGGESDLLARMPLGVLIGKVRRRETGEYHALWDAIARKGTPATIGWLLYEFLLSDRPYLERYHCARVLLPLVGLTDIEPVELSAARPNRQENLARLRTRLESLAPQPLP